MNLFAYGTLMWPEVLEAVIGRYVEGVPATLHGYLRLRVRGERYPAIVPVEGDDVEGILYTGLTDADFRHLDRFEGEEYDRLERVVGDAGAQVYVLSERWRHIAEERPWDPEPMRPEHWAAFCKEFKGCKGWTSSHKLGQGTWSLAGEAYSLSRCAALIV